MLRIEYDGTRYAGWQVQANAKTVAGAIERALSKIVGEPVRLVGAGRTDEGVHAQGQVANFLTRFSHPLDGLVTAANDELPEDIGIIDARDVGPDFHARHSASSRVYHYVVARRRSVFTRRRAWVTPKRIDLARLREATESIVGFHDFRAFCDRKLLGENSSKVDVTHAGWKEGQEQLVFRIAASHYLPRMVRRLVGCLVRVGTGEITPETFKFWLESGEGETGPNTAPAMGLYLEHVEYPPRLLRAPTHPTARRALEALDALDEEPSDSPPDESE